MFECARGHVTKPGERQVRVPTEIRQREYVNEGEASHGWEIVQEEALCVEHALEHGVDTR